MTVNVLTPGHIKCLEWLTERCFVTVGLLTSKALKGYKKELMPYEDRKYIMDTIAIALGDMRVIAQESLNPSANLRKYKYTHIASGDGWEKVEKDAAKKFNLEMIDIKLKGEKKSKLYSSSKIIK